MGKRVRMLSCEDRKKEQSHIDKSVKRRSNWKQLTCADVLQLKMVTLDSTLWYSIVGYNNNNRLINKREYLLNNCSMNI